MELGPRCQVARAHPISAAWLRPIAVQQAYAPPPATWACADGSAGAPAASYDARRPLPDALAHRCKISRGPARFHPPCDACISPGAHYGRCAFGIIAGCFAFPGDIEWRGERAI